MAWRRYAFRRLPNGTVSRKTAFAPKMGEGAMAIYHFHVENNLSEDFELELSDDDAAVREALKTAADMMLELPVQTMGEVVHWLEVQDANGGKLLKLRIVGVRGR